MSYKRGQIERERDEFLKGVRALRGEDNLEERGVFIRQFIHSSRHAPVREKEEKPGCIGYVLKLLGYGRD